MELNLLEECFDLSTSGCKFRGGDDGKNVSTGIHNHYPFELQHLGEPDRSFENQTVLRTPIGRMIDASVILNVTTTVGFLDQRLIYW